MEYSTPLSIWNGETSMDDWYRKSIAAPSKPKTTATNMMYATEAAFNSDTKITSKSSFFSDNSIDQIARGTEGSTTRNKLNLRVSTDKPLPNLPQDAYFEYLFSKAEIEAKRVEEAKAAKRYVAGPSFWNHLCNSPLTPDYLLEDVASPPEDQPATPNCIDYENQYYGFDSTIIKQEGEDSPTFDAQYAIDNAGTIALGTQPVHAFVPAAMNVADTVTNSNPNLFTSEDTEITDTDATTGFYGGYHIEESPSPYHAPNIDDAGFGDIRDGCEHVPEQWTHSETQAAIVAPYKITRDYSDCEDVEMTVPSLIKPILQPKSQIAKAARTCDMGFSAVYDASSIATLAEHLGVEQVNVLKRPARDSNVTEFDNDSASEDFTDNDDEEDDDDKGLHATKKARLSSHGAVDAEAIYAPIPSDFRDLKHKSSISSISHSTFHGAGNFSETTEGFPGQFKALVPPTKLFHPKILSGDRPSLYTFGTIKHANGLFYHTRFQASDKKPYSSYNLDYSTRPRPTVAGPVGRALRQAEKNTDLALVTIRTIEEENLRRESHLECTMAALEGVSVGEYRYYQGHSSVEEYNAGGMCVCWDECFCSQMCTRFADMLCPCKKHIVFDV